MRTPSLVLVSLIFSLAALVLPSGAATAQTGYPIANAAPLTRSPLYTAGRLPGASCAERPVKAGSVVSVKSYLTPLVKCLDAAWTAQFARARLPFAKPRVTFITKPQRMCGSNWGKDVQAIYCNTDRRIVLMLDRDVVGDPGDLYLLDVLAHEYGHHVQNVAGMWRALDRLPSRNKAEFYEQTRRHELQAECLAGAFIGSVWPSLDRDAGDWKELLDADRRSGDESTGVRDHGKGRNIANWLNRGFKAASPSACNTWIAGSSMVA
ncbi:neutral zinc metallopeptidase [Sphaerisporangium sp. TRM90804]|uniref:neutral zinc metallopeptidase n=1 Tax=Sphaerisporangium sp. TRM90804 TaxID=3031113 RepID=UPI00244B2E97|nr:neutral zinc metallopeptidase [Sphaerisporangium sp. TRM90804]MDH2424261.1 neutral zinc metallopeptidase [Sphaerisporangium sp. TRM90804]